MKIRVSFPFMIKQVSSNVVEIETKSIGSVCSQNVYSAIQSFSDEEHDRVIDVMTETFNRLYVQHSIKTSIVRETPHLDPVTEQIVTEVAKFKQVQQKDDF